MANLWDVTDKDIDKFAESTFTKWGLGTTVSEFSTLETSNSRSKISKLRKEAESKAIPQEKNDMSLTLAVNSSRGVCKLKYLTGAAPVVYGIPVWMKA